MAKRKTNLKSKSLVDNIEAEGFELCTCFPKNGSEENLRKILAERYNYHGFYIKVDSGVHNRDYYIFTPQRSLLRRIIDYFVN